MREMESLKPIVETLGYVDEKAMLIDLYEVQGFSIDDLAKKLGYSHSMLRRRLVKAGIKLRTRGGNNSREQSVLRGLPDDKFADVNALAVELNMHYSTIYKEKRKRGLVCTSVPSPQPESSTDTPVEAATSSVSPTSPTEIEDTLNGIETELRRETASYSTMEPTRRLVGDPPSISGSLES